MKGKYSMRFLGLLGIWVILMAASGIVFFERIGIRPNLENTRSIQITGRSEAVRNAEAYAEQQAETLVFMDSTHEGSAGAFAQFERILLDMKVGKDVVDIADEWEMPELSDYRTAIVLLTNLGRLGKEILTLSDWVRDGGRVLFAMTLEKENYFMLIEQKLGLIDSDFSNVPVDSIWVSDDFMLGGGNTYLYEDSFDSALAVAVSGKAKVYARIGDETGMPLVWSNDYGKGRFVVVNIGIYEKATRGFYASAYSLLEDAFAYPVINAMGFDIDDFPSPVPSGDGTYIRKDYGVSVAEFYWNIWWPDMLAMASKYGIRYTGLVIENYEDDTSGEIVKQDDLKRFQYFGNMLLNQGGEFGYHGYNHQPLSLGNVDYGDILPYNTWASEEAMENALSELIRFVNEIFPYRNPSVYVPPSNVLSAEGRQMISEKFPEINSIASNYFPGEFSYEQEYEIAEDGIIEQPRSTSGAIMDWYLKLIGVSELNMHLISRHFMHPDDVLDEDRGAELGWEVLKDNLDSYFSWLFSSAPQLRRLTASETAAAIERFSSLAVNRDPEENSLRLTFNHLADEAWMLVRLPEGAVPDVSAGTIEEISNGLWLLCVQADDVSIRWNEAQL